MTTTVLVAARGAQEVELLQGFEADRGFTITRRCGDGPELTAAATAGVGQLAILHADFCPIDLDFLTGIKVTGCTIILLVESADHAPLARVATQMGIAVAGTVTEAITTAQEWRARSRARDQEIITDGALNSRGKIAAIWGPAGAPGRTTFAIEIASHLAASGARTLLIDADPYGGMIAPALGLLDEASGLIAATREAGRGTLTPDGLLEHAAGISKNLRALVGIPRADRWPELMPTALDNLWEIARSSAHWTIIDCGFSLESDEELTFDTHAPQRNGATLSALGAADAVVAVGQGDPVSIPRLVRGLAELRQVVQPEHLLTVVTRVRRSVAGGGASESIREILARYAAVPNVYTILEDSEAFDTALLEGKSVLEIAPQSDASGAIAALVEELAHSAVQPAPVSAI